MLHEILHVAQRREYSFVQSQLLDTIEDQDKKLHAYLVEDYRVRNEEFIESLAQGIWALLGETKEEKVMAESGSYTNCIECDKAIPEKAARRCPVCNQRPLCGRCSAAHSESCQKLPGGYTCKLCGSSFKEFGDFTKHAETCVRPTTEITPSTHCFGCSQPIPLGQQAVYWNKTWYCNDRCLQEWKSNNGERPSVFRCNACDLDFDMQSEAAAHCDVCQPEAPKPGGNYGLHNLNAHIAMCKRLEELEVRVEPDAAVQNIHARSISALEKKAEEPGTACSHDVLDVQSWFQLRVPTEQEAKDMDTLRATYTSLALDLEILCPEGADRMAALRLLKQSMHTAIGSIVTMDAWQTPKGD